MVAEWLGHKSSRSGTFLTKIASMRDYGLIDGRGKVRVTEIGEKIAFHKTDEEYSQALIRAANKIPLWRLIYEKYTQKGLDIPDADFWYDLKEFCDLTIEQAKTLAPTVLAAFKEDTKGIRVGILIPQPVQPESQPKTPSQPAAPSIAEGYIPIGYGDTRAILPKEGTKDAWNKLKAIVDAYVQAS